MAAIASRATAGPPKSQPKPQKLANLSEMSVDAVLSEIDRLTSAGHIDLESDKERCNQCLERCDELWDDDENWDDRRNLPHARALLLCCAVMWIACKRGDLGTSKVDRRLFVYACMVLPACIVSVADEQNEWGYPAGAAELVDSTELALRERVKDPEVTLAHLLATGLERLNEQPNPSSDVALPVLRALEGFVQGLVQWGDGGDDEGKTLGAMSGVDRKLRVHHATALMQSGALATAIATAELHRSNSDVSICVLRMLVEAAGERPDRLLVPLDDSASSRSVSLCDALASLGALSLATHAIRSFTQTGSLMTVATRLLDLLTGTEGGRRAARECQAASALDVLIRQCTEDGDAEEEDEGRGVAGLDFESPKRDDLAGLDVEELKVLRAVLGSEDIAGIMNELAPGSMPDGAWEDDDMARGEVEGGEVQVESRGDAGNASNGPSIAHVCRKFGETAWYWY